MRDMLRRIPAFVATLTVSVVFAQAPAFEISATVTDTQGKPLADAVLVAVPAEGALPPARSREDSVDQVDKQFVPRVMPVLVGTSVSFPNNDNVRHQVYSFSPAKRFELPLYAGVPAQPIVFDKPGVVVLGCNIHDWMIGYVYVSESPYFAKTGANGKARISNLPPRAYVVRVWHPQAETQEEATRKTIDAAARTVEVEWMLKVKPEARVRRAPSSDRGARY
jgi:plastocyanin